MIYSVQLSIIHPESLKAILLDVVLTIDSVAPDYKDIVYEFFKHWDREDKYTTCYAIGVTKMHLLNDN